MRGLALTLLASLAGLALARSAAADATVIIESVTDARPVWAEDLAARWGERLRERRVDAVLMSGGRDTFDTQPFDARGSARLDHAYTQAVRRAAAGEFGELLWEADAVWWGEVEPRLATVTSERDLERALELSWYRALAHLRLGREAEARGILQDSLRLGIRLEPPRADAGWPADLVELHREVSQAATHSGVLVLRAHPAQAQLFLDGHYLGQGTATATGLPPGRYHAALRLNNQWGRTYHLEVQDRREEVDLSWWQDRFVAGPGLRFSSAAERQEHELEAVQGILSARSEARALVLGLDPARSWALLGRVEEGGGVRQARLDREVRLDPRAMDALEVFLTTEELRPPLRDPRDLPCQLGTPPYWVGAGLGLASIVAGAVAFALHEGPPPPDTTEVQPPRLFDGKRTGAALFVAGAATGLLSGAGLGFCALRAP